MHDTKCVMSLGIGNLHATLLVVIIEHVFHCENAIIQ